MANFWFNLSSLDGTNGFKIDGISSNAKSVNGAGDINGDGIDDIIIGDFGKSYVLFGDNSNVNLTRNVSSLDGTNGFVIEGIRRNTTVSSAGDINADGIDDLIIGGLEQSFVLFGKTTGFTSSFNVSSLNGNNGFAINNISGLTFVQSAGDINDDGIEDIMIGASEASPNGSSSGEIYVIFGKSGGFNSSLNPAFLDGSNGFSIKGSVYDRAGTSISPAGDINGDGIDDLVIGAPNADPNGSNSGQTYVVFGKNSGFSASLELSSLNGSNGFTINGIEAGDRAGTSVGGVGDVNGNGVDDLIIGAPEADPNGSSSGESYVIFGKSGIFNPSLNLSSLDGVNGFKLNGIITGDSGAFPGHSVVSGAGDINADGIDDLIIGAPRADPNGNDSGQSYVVYGTSSGFGSSFDLFTLNGSNGYKINGIAANNESGYSVNSAGDVNGDGIDDVIIGSNAGESYVIYGNPAPSLEPDTTSNPVFGFKINGIAFGDRLGHAVNRLGDINGDGIDDLIISAPEADPNGSNSGQIYVLYGKTGDFGSSFDLSTLDGSNGFKINGIGADDQAGISISNAGDINGDGINDLVIGAPHADPNGSSTGQIYIVYGKSSGFGASFDLSTLNGNNGFKINGVINRFGFSVSAAGDVNGDGIDDLIIGAPGFVGNFVSPGGRSYVVFGKTSAFSANLDLSTLNGSNGFTISSIYSSRLLGYSVSSAGDINNDGFDDLIIGDFDATPNGVDLSDAGVSYVVFGLSGFEPNLNPSSLNGSNGFQINGIATNDNSGWSVNHAGDINGDGIDDLIIGALKADPNGSNSGQTYVVFGKNSGFASDFNLSSLNGSNGFQINGIADGDYSGSSVSGAGDVNGDGVDDLIIGVPGADPNGNVSGQTYVVFGKTSSFSATLELSSLDGTNGFKINGIAAADNSGFSVSGAGDINADGIDDLVIGAPDADINGSESGQSYVVFGHTNIGTNGTLELYQLIGSARDTTTIITGNPTASVTEDTNTPNLTATGALTITDPDSGEDKFNTTVTPTVGNLGNLTITDTGTFNYTVDNSAVQYLSATETKTETFTVTSLDGTASEDITITITGANDNPTATDDTPTTDEDTAITGNVLTNDSDIDNSDILTIARLNGTPRAVGKPVTLFSGALLTLNSDGTFTYNPNNQFEFLGANQTEIDGFAYTVSDGNGGISNAIATITITGINNPATITGIATAAVTEDSDTPTLTAIGSLSITDTDSDEDKFNSTVISAPSNLGSLTITDTGSFNYSVDNSAVQYLGEAETQTETFTVTALDGTATQDITITITGVNDTPTATDDNPTTDENTALTDNVLTNDSDADSTASLTVVDINGNQTDIGNEITLASGALLTLNSDGSYTYNPNGQFASLGVNQTATDSFTYTISDEKGETSSATATITVTGVNNPAVITGITEASVAEDSSTPTLTATGSLTVTDTDTGEDKFSTTVVSAPSNLGSLTITDTGTFTYSVDNSAVQYLGTGDSKTETFTVSSLDGVTSDITITLTGVNDNPIGRRDRTTTAQDTSVTIQTSSLLRNDRDIDSAKSSLSITGVSNETNGTAVFDNNNTPNDTTDDLIIFTPNQGFSGNGSFTYTLSDGSLTNTATVTVAVGENIDGTDNDDFLIGSAGNDRINGLEGWDQIDGSFGDDILNGGLDDDILNGGFGADIFVLALDGSIDMITDFNIGQGDKIGLSGGLEFDQLTFSGEEIWVGNQTLAVLRWFDTTTLTSANFITV